MCDVWSDGAADAWSDTVLTARKAHQCDGCGTTIRPGEAYCRHWAITDGSRGNGASCAACWFARQAFGESHHFYPWPSTLREFLRDCVAEDDAPEWRAALAALIRRNREAVREATT